LLSRLTSRLARQGALSAIALLAVALTSFSLGVAYGRRDMALSRAAVAATDGQAEPGAGTARTGARPADAPPGDLGQQFDPFWEAWNFVEGEYYRQPVDRARLVQGAIRGMLSALNDQYAAYLDPIATRVDKRSLDGVSEGIGAQLELRERRFVLIAPIEDGPAARAGLHTGDLVLRVDGQEIGALSLAEAMQLVNGSAGSKVKLLVQKIDDPQGQPVEVELTRTRVELETVSSRLVAEGIGYVRVRLFGTQTLPQLQRALRDMRGRRVRGLILDLRDNPGGYLSGAVDVASQFLKEGSVVVYEERTGSRRAMLARGGGLATDTTLAVLVNRGSASAAEIVAGALADHGRGVLIGETTFGKGSVQLPRELADGSSIRVTAANWATPSGKVIQGQGLAPAIPAKPTAEDEQSHRDVVLERALEWFKATPLQGTPVQGTPPVEGS
jgi:carboxyl-terminal processing protease